MSVEASQISTSISSNSAEAQEPSVSSEPKAVDAGIASELANEPKMGDPVEEAVEEAKQKIEQNDNHESDKFAKKFAALSRKEKELKQKEAELENKLKEFQSADTLREQLKQNPVKMLEEMGITYQDITEMVLNEGNPTPEMLINKMKSEYEEKLESLRNEYLEDKKAEEEAKYNAVIENFQQEIVEHVNSNEDYELIRAQDRADLVYDVIEEHYEETGRVLEINEAADAVEQYLLQEAKKLLKVKKLGGQLSDEEQQQLDDSGLENPSQKSEEKKSVTLTNNQTTTVPNRRERALSREESLAEAAKLIRWNE